ncbi:MAG: family transcriptional regulator, cyclic receptor protein [Acidimicrobiaceae bacterium]|jgi:CRP/FNR family cyclic AMP-dependent transcriptional regulator
MAGRDSYLDHLAQVPLFAACSRKELQTIAKASDEVTVPSDKVLVEQGTSGRECFVIVDGTASVKRNGRRVATLGPGSYFGELSLLDKGPRTATVTAETPLTVLVLGPREFSSVLDAVPGLSHKLLTTLATRVRDLDTKAYG